MECYFKVIGMFVVGLSSFCVVVFGAWYVIEKVIDFFGRRFNSLWRVVEYAHYHKQFKKWMKDNNKNSVTGLF